MNDLSILKVSQLNTYLKAYIDENSKLKGLYVRGEVTDFKGSYLSGHLYFALKDETSEVRCVMFKSYADRVRFNIENGMSVILRCDLTVYAKSASCQLCVYDLQPDGLGAKYLAFLQLKEKLKNEGLFDESIKKSLPRYPKKIGVITSAQGAAIHDIENVISRRWPLAKIVLTSASVQGENAPKELIDGLIAQESTVKPDLIIIGRGGGSSEDLSAFNDEALARQIFRCQIPVISAVGHEVDFSICDLVADLRAPTPSAAAELAVPDMNEVLMDLDANSAWLYEMMERKIASYEDEIKSLSEKGFSILKAAELYELKVKNFKDSLSFQMSKYLSDKELQIKENLLKLDSNNPSKILERSVCIVEKDQKQVKSIQGISKDDVLNVNFVDGILETKVINVTERKDSK